MITFYAIYDYLIVVLNIWYIKKSLKDLLYIPIVYNTG